MSIFIPPEIWDMITGSWVKEKKIVELEKKIIELEKKLGRMDCSGYDGRHKCNTMIICCPICNKYICNGGKCGDDGFVSVSRCDYCDIICCATCVRCCPTCPENVIFTCAKCSQPCCDEYHCKTCTNCGNCGKKLKTNN